MPDNTAKKVSLELLAGGGSTALVSALLNPLDVIKTRRQLPQYAHMRPLQIASKLFTSGQYAGGGVCDAGAKGVSALYVPGLKATIVRELLYSGCTKGLYPAARDVIANGRSSNQLSLWERALASALTGWGGACCANAIDVIKIRQFEHANRYPSLTSALVSTAREEGIMRGLLLRGLSASAPRGAAIAVGEVTTYDHTKTVLKNNGYFRNNRKIYGDYVNKEEEEPFSLHVVTSLITGVVATTVAAPFDMLKSRVMADNGQVYKGFMSALSQVLTNEGPAALFRGWWPAYCRLGPHAILTFPLFEQMRTWFGLKNL